MIETRRTLSNSGRQTSKLIWRQSTLIRSVEFAIPSNHLERGCRFRFKNQVPVVTDGQEQTVRAVVGSVRGLTFRRGMLCGNLRWASDAAAQAMRQKVDDGNLQYKLNILELEVDHKNNVTRWMPLSVSLTAGQR